MICHRLLFLVLSTLLTSFAFGQELSSQSQSLLNRLSRATGNTYDLEKVQESAAPAMEIMGKRTRPRTNVYSRKRGTGHLVSFSYTADLRSIRLSDTSIPHRELKAGKQISDAEAVERVRACATEFQQNPYDRADVMRIKTSSELAGQELYRVFLYEAPDGVPARTGNTFSALVDPRDGAIVEMTFRDTSEYNAKPVSVTAEGAQETAVNYVKSMGFTGKSGSNGLTWYNTGNDLAKSDRQENVKAYELWVEKGDKEPGHIRVWVDAQNGNVVGTASVKGARQTPGATSQAPQKKTFNLSSIGTSGKQASSGASWPLLLGGFAVVAGGGFALGRMFGRSRSA